MLKVLQVSKPAALMKKFRHHMLREIFDEPAVLRATIEAEVDNTRKIAQAVKSEGYEMFYITGSGTSLSCWTGQPICVVETDEPVYKHSSSVRVSALGSN